MTVDICFSGNLLRPPSTPLPVSERTRARPQKPGAFAAAAPPEKWPTINLALLLHTAALRKRRAVSRRFIIMPTAIVGIWLSAHARSSVDSTPQQLVNLFQEVTLLRTQHFSYSENHQP